MRLKSISPFIASVLLIGFTIASGIIVYYFLTTLPKVQTTEVSSLSQQVISCAGGFFDVKNFNGIYRKPITIYPFNFVNSSDSRTLTINTTNNQLKANHSFYLVKVSPFPSYASLTIYYKSLTSTASGALFDIFVNGNKLGTLTVPSGISSYTFTNVSINWLVSNALNNITYQNASINLDSLQIINSTLNYNATLSNDLNDYQILITIDTASLISQGKLKNDCSDIRFLDSDDKTLLNYWIESDCNTANTKIWVKVPNIPSLTTKTIYVYYGNPTANSLSDSVNTFRRNGLVGGWHFDEGSGNIAYDYSGYNNHGIVSNIAWTNGRFGKAVLFDEQLYNDLSFVLIPNFGTINSSYTISFWVNFFNAPNKNAYLNWCDDNNCPEIWLNWYDATIRVYISQTNAGPAGRFKEWKNNTWYNIVVVYDKVNKILTYFVNGVIDNKFFNILTNFNESFKNNLYINCRFATPLCIAIIDEFQIYNKSLREEEIIFGYYGLTTNIGNEENITISLLSSGNPSASMGNQFTSIIYLTNGTIIQRDFSLDNNCNLGKDCPLGKSTISLNSSVPIDKIRVCSKACNLICNEIKVS